MNKISTVNFNFSKELSPRQQETVKAAFVPLVSHIMQQGYTQHQALEAICSVMEEEDSDERL